MARKKPAAAKAATAPAPFVPLDELGGGIETAADDGDEDLIKIIEQPPNENKSGIVIEDADMPDGPALPPDVEAPPPEEAPVKATLSPSAQATLDAELAAGRAALKKFKSGN